MGEPDASCLGTCRRSALKKLGKLRIGPPRSVAHGTNPSLERKRKRAAGTVIEVIDAYLLYAKGANDPVERAGDEQPAQIAITSFADTAEPVFTSARVLLWHDADPAREVTS